MLRRAGRLVAGAGRTERARRSRSGVRVEPSAEFSQASGADRPIRCRRRRRSSAGICSTTGGCRPTARSRVPVATSRSARSPTARARPWVLPGEVHPRGSMSLVNVAYAAALTWANPSPARLEDQVLMPMFGTHPVELGLPDDDTQLIARLRAEPHTRRCWRAAFGADAPFTREQRHARRWRVRAHDRLGAVALRSLPLRS